MTEPIIMRAEPVLRQKLELGESARWFGDALHWIDVTTGRSFRWRGGTSPTESVEHPDIVTAVFDSGSGSAGVVGRDAVQIPGRESLALGIAEGRTNDARVDARGRLWVGTWMPDVAARAARLLRVSGDDVREVRSGLTMSNGLGFAGDVVFHVDTFAREINRYDLDEAGEIRDASILVTVEDALPDGAAVDADGGVWVALWGGGCARRYDGSGRCTHEVRTPGATQVTSVALGGLEGRSLFLTTAAEGVDEREAGSVFRATVDVGGVREYAFGKDER